MRKAYLHIGMPKTGTTALQESLSQSRRILSDHGVIYPGTGLDHVALLPLFHQHEAKHFFFKNSGVSQEEAIGLARRFTRELRQTSESFDGDFLLSTEYMHNVSRPGLRRLNGFLAKIGFELMIICYVRHPFSMATSSIQQNVKMGHGVLAEMIRVPRWHSQRAALETPLLELGRDRIIVRTFEDARDIGTERDVLRAIGFAGPLDQIASMRVNESLSMAGILLADAQNRLQRQGQLHSASKGYLFQVGGPKFALPASSIEAMRAGAEAELAWLGENFGILIEEPKAGAESPANLLELVAEDILKLIVRHER